LRIFASMFTKEIFLYFSILEVSWSGFGVRVIMASKNELSSVPSFLLHTTVWEGLVLVL
jgi:hypothetical protein